MEDLEGITSLNVHSLDGNFYHDTKAYLEKQGCKWSEKRGREGELLTVHLDFPQGTVFRILEQAPEVQEKYERRQVVFASGGLMYWAIKKVDQTNGIAVPYAWL
jgi:hypothetical protein